MLNIHCHIYSDSRQMIQTTCKIMIENHALAEQAYWQENTLLRSDDSRRNVQ